MRIHLFGASSSVGEAFLRQVSTLSSSAEIYVYGRKEHSSKNFYFYCDLNNPNEFVLGGGDHSIPSVLISFAPIWLFSPFLRSIVENNPSILSNVLGLFVCSSSSCQTKKYASNYFDRQLSKRLFSSEREILNLCLDYDLSCSILQPSLIYGKVGSYSDHNLSIILKLLRYLPMLPLPAQSGLRQPIHAKQLAAVFILLTDKSFNSKLDSHLLGCITIGGDSTLTYAKMIILLQKSQSITDLARSCLLLAIPNRIFFFLAAPILLLSPKKFESILRISSNLSGFTPVHEILGCEPNCFPLLPIE